LIGVTIRLGLALLAWRISLDIVWLRLCFFVVFLFGGLFLKRVLTIGALGSAIGLKVGTSPAVEAARSQHVNSEAPNIVDKE